MLIGSNLSPLENVVDSNNNATPLSDPHLQLFITQTYAADNCMYRSKALGCTPPNIQSAYTRCAKHREQVKLLSKCFYSSNITH